MQPTPAPAAAPQPSSQDINKAYSDLFDDLNEAFWAAGTMAAKDQIKGVMDAVTEVITDLDAADLDVRDAAFTTLSTQVAITNKELQTLQKQIGGLVSRINVAASVVSDIGKVVGLAAKVFPV